MMLSRCTRTNVALIAVAALTLASAQSTKGSQAAATPKMPPKFNATVLAQLHGRSQFLAAQLNGSIKATLAYARIAPMELEDEYNVRERSITRLGAMLDSLDTTWSNMYKTLFPEGEAEASVAVAGEKAKALPKPGTAGSMLPKVAPNHSVVKKTNSLVWKLVPRDTPLPSESMPEK
mmetsp:Transcript_27601/g.64401  ORF Transcript_27601/g.64401 Transcript_27601/m.64401 type:complete len:177 (-) Transcript_27601:380-910(-)